MILQLNKVKKTILKLKQKKKYEIEMEEDQQQYLFSIIEKIIKDVKKENISIPNPEFIPSFEIFINYM